MTTMATSARGVAAGSPADAPPGAAWLPLSHGLFALVDAADHAPSYDP